MYKREAGLTLKDVEQLIQWDPTDYTAWSARRELIGEGDEKELDYTRACILQDPKSYQAWHHRRWVMCCILPKLSNAPLNITPAGHPDVYGLPAWPEFEHVTTKWCEITLELYEKVASMLRQEHVDLTLLLVEHDAKNHNVWQYWQWLVYPFLGCRDLTEELAWAEKFILTDFRNNSAWNYRRWIIENARPDQQLNLAVKECQFVLDWLREAPNDESLINHLKR